MWKSRQYLLLTALPFFTALIFISWIISSMHTYSFALTAEDIIALRQAGLYDETIEVIIRHQADLTGLIDVKEVIRMKQAGVSNEVIRALADPKVSPAGIKEYGTHVGNIKEISTMDLLRLKQAGFDDHLIKAIIQMQRENMWPFLLDLGIIKCPDRKITTGGSEN
jgi:hypothetical protein